jgi:hypothetical protein
MTEQTQLQETAGRYPNRYRPGQSGNLAGRPSRAQQRALVLAKAHELAQELGGYERLSPIERTLIERAADLLCKRPRRYDECVRRDNLVSRILRDVLLRHRPADGRNSQKPLRDRLVVGA